MTRISASTVLSLAPEAPVIYRIVPSVTTVSRSAAGVVTPAIVSARIERVQGSESERLSYGTVKFERNDSGYLEPLTVTAGGTVQGVNIGTSNAVTFHLYSPEDGQEIANARVPVVADGEPGKPGNDGGRGIYIPFPRMWEEYPEGYLFETGEMEGDVRQDVVLVKDGTSGSIVACRCEQNHLKLASAPHRPDPNARTEWWRPASSLPFMTVETLVALRAFIGGLTVGGLVMTDAEGNVVMTAEGGEVSCRKGRFENVEVSGTVVAGELDGKRVMLDPEGKSVRIFDDGGNECARLDGSGYTEASVMPGSGAKLPEPDGKVLTLSATGDAVATGVDSVVAVSPSAATRTGIGSVRITASASVRLDASGGSAPGGEAEWMRPVEMADATVRLTVSTYADDGVTLVGRSRHWITGCAENLDGSYVGSATRTFTVAVPEGRHEVTFELTAAGGRADATVRLTEMTFVADGMMTRYFSNGFALTKNAENYLISLLEEGRMRLLLGGEFRRDGVGQPAVVYAARITDSSKSASVSPSRVELTKLPGVTVGLAKGASATDGYRLTFPAAYGLTEANTGFRLTGYGPVADSTSNPAKAGVKSVAVSGGVMTVTVWVADDASPNYGGFYIEVLRY